jgi:hypothetical protein
LNLFEEGVSPTWEDPKNNYGKTLTLAYVVNDKLDEFLNQVQNYWIKLILFVISESLDGNKYVNTYFNPLD